MSGDLVHLRLEVELHRSGVLRTRAHLTGTGPGTYWLDHLTLFLPVPEDTADLVDFTGEVGLGPGDTYTGPWLCGSFGPAGLDELSGRFHAFLRDRPRHPSSPPPVVVNTWEAVYFDHDLERPTRLARAAAAAWGAALPWCTPQGVRLTGRALATAGLRLPVLYPDRVMLVRATEASRVVSA